MRRETRDLIRSGSSGPYFLRQRKNRWAVDSNAARRGCSHPALSSPPLLLSPTLPFRQVYPLVGIISIGATWGLYMSAYSIQHPEVSTGKIRRSTGGNTADSDYEYATAANHWQNKSLARTFITDVVGTYTERNYPEAYPHDRLKDARLLEKR